MSAFFISDIHLHPLRPATVAQLLAVFQRIAKETETPKQLFLLGDIFDAWIGDDDPEPLWQEIKSELRNLTNSGIHLYWIAGNRDFLVGPRFMQETGCQYLSEPHAVTLSGGHRVVLLHGDLLCTQDTRYQRFRRIVRHPATLWLYRHLPLSWRLRVARGLRKLSRPPKTTTKDPEGKKDWIDEAVSDALLIQHQATTLIHGHIHRAGVHPRTLLENGNTRAAQRIVLGDWDVAPSVLVFSEGQFKFLDVS
jgi:UDP-2,3-diacylglucosamine hydrolase